MFVLIGVTNAMAVDYYVDPSGTDDLGHGTGSGTNAWETIQYAVTNVSNPTTATIVIHVSADTYTLGSDDIDIDRSFTDLTIQGAGVNSTIVQSEATANTATDNVFSITTNETVTIKDMTIRYGKVAAGSNGGGITNEETLTIINCRISNNKYDSGDDFGAGGIYSDHSSKISIYNTTIDNNTCNGHWEVGAGFYCGQSVDVIIENSTFNNNKGIASNPLQANDYKDISGAFGCYRFCDIKITNCTFTNNETNDNGGAMVLYYGQDIFITNCTIVNNTSGQNGGGIFYQSDGAGFDLVIKNTILANNTDKNGTNDFYALDADSGGRITDNGYNIVEFSVNKIFNASGDITGNQADLNISSTLTDNGTLNGTQTLALSAGSVAIDAGASGTNGVVNVPTTDQRGISVDGTTDIGAYQAQLTVLSVQLDYNDGASPALIVTWSKDVTTTNVDETKFHIRNSTLGGDIIVTPAEASVVGAVVNFNFSEAQRAAVLAKSGVAGGDGGAVVLDIEASAAQSKVGLKNNAASNNNTATETADTKDPSISSWSLDLSAPTITLNFSETVDVSTRDLTAITIQDAATAASSHTLTTSNTTSGDGTSIVINLSTADKTGISAFAVNIGTSYLRTTTSLINDIATRSNTAIANGAAPQATAYTGPTAASASKTTVVASPTGVYVGGSVSITVTPKDASGTNLGTGEPVSLSTTLGSLVGSVSDAGDGTYSQSLTSSVAGGATVTATVRGVVIDQKPAVVFHALPYVPTPVNPDKTTVSVVPTKITADGISTSLITVIPRDDNSVRLGKGESVSLFTTNGTLLGSVSYDKGEYTQLLQSSVTPGTATIKAKVNNVVMSTEPIVTFAPREVSVSITTVVANPTSIVNDGESISTITVTPKDASGNLLGSGQNVELFTTAGALIGGVADSGNGIYTGSLQSSTDEETAVVTARVNSVTINQQAMVTFTAEPVTVELSPDPLTLKEDEQGTLTATVTQSESPLINGAINFLVVDETAPQLSPSVSARVVDLKNMAKLNNNGITNIEITGLEAGSGEMEINVVDGEGIPVTADCVLNDPLDITVATIDGTILTIPDTGVGKATSMECDCGDAEGYLVAAINPETTALVDVQPVTDESGQAKVLVVGKDNGQATVSAAVEDGSGTATVNVRIPITIWPDTIWGSRWFPLCKILLIKGKNAHFALAKTQIDFDTDDVLKIVQLVLNETGILLLILLNNNPEEGSYDITVSTGDEVAGGVITIKLLPWILIGENISR